MLRSRQRLDGPATLAIIEQLTDSWDDLAAVELDGNLALALTDAGCDRLVETAPVHSGGVDKSFLSRLDDEQLAILETALDQVTVDCTSG